MENSATNVFLSYSRKNITICETLNDNLKRQGINVFVDTQDITYGENIRAEIVKLLQQAHFFIVIVSEHSLLSSWVIWEIQQYFQMNNIREDSKIIPVFIDNKYLDDDYIKQIIEKVDNEYQQVVRQIYDLSKKSIPTDSFESKKQNLLNFKNAISKIIEFIRSTNAIDLSPINFEPGFLNLYQLITGYGGYIDPRIISPAVYKITDKTARIKEIELLVAEDNLPEAASRTLDFVNEFYQDHTDYIHDKKAAISISNKIHYSEKNLPKDFEMINFNGTLVNEILDLIYKSIPMAA